MSLVILQVNIKVNKPAAEVEQNWLRAANIFADMPGLRWKVWIKNEEEQEVGGIYLFEDEASVQAYLNGPIAAALRSNPANVSVSVKQFNIMEAHTAITRGPIGHGEQV